MAVIDDLIKQIQAQGTTGKWSGGYAPDAATKDMARILAGIGITDINQFGKIPQYQTQNVYNGQQVGFDEDGRAYISTPNGGTDDYGQPTMGREYVDPSQVKEVKVQTGTTYGNKETGQAVPITYSERQTGNAWGGTFEGKGNTGYRVEFDAQGKPLFYTTGASSSSVPSWVAPALAIGGLAFGVPALGELLGGLGAAGAGEIAASDLLASELGADAAAGLLGGGEAAGTALAQELGTNAGLLGGGEMSGSDILARDLATDIGTGTVGGMSEAELAQANMALGGAGGSAGATELESALASGTPTVTNTALTGGSGVLTGAAGGITADSVAQKLAGDTAGAATVAAKSPLSVSDAIRLAGIGATLAGGAKLANNLGSGGGGAYDIVPIPSDWTSPIKPTGTAEFTPLAPIDFGNKEMLRGTQWEKLLSPDYGKSPVTPSMPVNPSNMSYDELTKILGSSRTSIPTQNVSINDVIAGIQSQYGQAPKS